MAATFLAAIAEAQQRNRPVEWKPRLGILGQYTEANVRFAREEGFTNMILEGTQRSAMDATSLTDQKIETVKQYLAQQGMHVSAFQVAQNHISPDPARRKQENDYFVKMIELAGKLGVPYVGTCSGKDADKSFEQQVSEIVRVYNDRYFAACQSNHVRILWEPWPGGPNIATGPVGFEALFKAFGDSPHVGLQYDPSHLVWQMMDPIQTARDFVDKIYDVHLKDTEILWHIVHRGGIQPVNNARWWRFRIPGYGSVDWKGFFSVLAEAGYNGAMNIENEDEFYYPAYNQGNFTEQFKRGFRTAHEFLKTLVPPVTA